MIESVRFLNAVTGKIIIMNDDNADYLIDPENGDIDWGEIEANHNTFNFPTQVGSYISSSMLEDREVSFSGWILGPSYQSLKSKKRELSAFFNPLQEIEIQAGGYSLFGRAQANVKYGNDYPNNNVLFCRFTVSLLCNKPLWETSKPIATNIAVLTPSWKFKWVMVEEKGKGTIFGKRRRDLLQKVTNNGALPVGILVTVKALGIVNNPQIKVVETQEIIRIDKTLNEDEEIIISTVNGERYITGRKNESSPWESYLKYFNLDSSWIQLPVGDTTIGFSTYSSGETPDETYKNMNITVSYRESLFNLEEE